MKRLLLTVFSAILLLSCGSGEQVPANPESLTLVSFESHGKFGFKDTSGNIIIQALYDGVYEFDTNRITAVVDSTGWMIINKKGEHILNPYIFDNGPDYFEEGLARYVENSKMGFFDKNGNKVIQARYDFAAPFKGGYSAVCNGCAMVPMDEEHSRIDGGKWGMIDRTGKENISLVYDMLIHFDEDSVTLKMEEKWYKMNIADKGTIQIAAPVKE